MRPSSPCAVLEDRACTTRSVRGSFRDTGIMSSPTDARAHPSRGSAGSVVRVGSRALALRSPKARRGSWVAGRVVRVVVAAARSQSSGLAALPSTQL